MNHISRILIADQLFTVDNENDRLVQVYNPDNIIPMYKLEQNGYYYTGYLEKDTYELYDGPDPSMQENLLEFGVPIDIMDFGYQEGSKEAELLNEKHNTNIKFLDTETIQQLEKQPFVYKHRDLPETILGKKTYIVDVAFNELRLKGNPADVIPIHQLPIKNGKYVIDKSKLQGHSSDLPDDNKFYVDQMVKLDPEGMALKYGISKDDLPENDHDMLITSTILHSRIDNGELPIFRIVSDDFYVVLRAEQLRPVNDWKKPIDLNTAHRTVDGRIIFFYDRIQNSIVQVPDSITELPKNLVMILLPNEVILDPVGCGSLLKGNPFAFLDKFPPQQKLEARVFPVEESYLPQLIHNNLKAAEMGFKRKQDDLKLPRQVAKKSKKGRGLK